MRVGIEAVGHSRRRRRQWRRRLDRLKLDLLRAVVEGVELPQVQGREPVPLAHRGDF